MTIKIDKEKETQLWSRWRESKTDEARNGLVELYLPRARKVAKSRWGRLPSRGKSEIDVEELVSVAVIGMIGAIESYDENNGASFTTYSSYRMFYSISDFYRLLDPFSRKTRSDLGDDLPLFFPLDYESEDYPELKKFEDLCCRRPVDYRDEQKAIDSRDQVEWYISSMSGLMREVVSLYSIEGLTMKETGDELHVCESRVSQIFSQAMSLMRQKAAAHNLSSPSG